METDFYKDFYNFLMNLFSIKVIPVYMWINRRVQDLLDTIRPYIFTTVILEKLSGAS